MFKIGKCGCCGGTACAEKDVIVEGDFYGFPAIKPDGYIEGIDEYQPIYRTVKARFEYECFSRCDLISTGATGWRETIWQCTRDGTVTKTSDTQSSEYRTDITWMDINPSTPREWGDGWAEDSEIFGTIIHGYDGEGDPIVTNFTGIFRIENLTEQDDANVRNMHDTFTIADESAVINFESNVLTAGTVAGACGSWGGSIPVEAQSCYRNGLARYLNDLSTLEAALYIPMASAPLVTISDSATAHKARRCPGSALAACIGSQKIGFYPETDYGTFWAPAPGTPAEHLANGVTLAPPVEYRRVNRAFLAWDGEANCTKCEGVAVMGDDSKASAIIGDDGTIIIN